MVKVGREAEVTDCWRYSLQPHAILLKSTFKGTKNLKWEKTLNLISVSDNVCSLVEGNQGKTKDHSADVQWWSTERNMYDLWLAQPQWNKHGANICIFRNKWRSRILLSIRKENKMISLKKKSFDLRTDGTDELDGFSSDTDSEESPPFYYRRKSTAAKMKSKVSCMWSDGFVSVCSPTLGAVFFWSVFWLLLRSSLY